jgi:rfaE bifunctional protein nucleotidyltransferase chain/domain
MNQLETLSKLIFSVDAPEFDRLLAFWRFKGYRIVFTNGCFDILHLGHVDYLLRASKLGDVLLVGLNTDASVSRIKGAHRPLSDEHSRSMVMASLRFVSAVALFDEDTPYELIKKVQPDVLVKGADYKPEHIVGYDIVKAKGGKISNIQLVEGYSTTAIEHKIRQASSHKT